MTNWTIFLLHFVAGVCYMIAGRMAGDNASSANKFALSLSMAIFLTATAAWI